MVSNVQTAQQSTIDAGKNTTYTHLDPNDFLKSLNQKVQELKDFLTPDKVDKVTEELVHGNFLCRNINSLESFSGAFRWQVATDYQAQNPDEQRAGCYSGLCGCAYGNINMEQEFQDYLQARGCNNVEELEILNKCCQPWENLTKDQLLEKCKMRIESTYIQLFVVKMGSDGMPAPGVYSADASDNAAISSIFANSSFKEMAEFYQATGGGFALMGPGQVEPATLAAFNKLLVQPPSADNLGQWLKDFETKEKEKQERYRQMIADSMGTYVPKSLKQHELAYAMSFYDGKKIDSLETFQKAFETQIENYYKNNPDADKAKTPEYNYEEAFQDYRITRGCFSIDDLKGLNQTDFRSTSDLMESIDNKYDEISGYFAMQGYPLSRDEYLSLTHINHSFSQLAELYKGLNSSPATALAAFDQFIKNPMKTDGEAVDETTKSLIDSTAIGLKALLEAIDNGEDIQAKLKDWKEKHSAASESEDNKVTPNKKFEQYKAALLAKIK